jgi:glycosyltransferase 2 family protein
MIDLKRIATRWILPLAGGAVAVAAIFYLYQGLNFGQFLTGLR